MILTNWGDPYGNPEIMTLTNLKLAGGSVTTTITNHASESMWLKIVSQWVVLLLYCLFLLGRDKIYIIL